ncbi:MAG: trypsin-like peptidase domain-containing protein [Bacteroidota bacterium]
MAVDEAKQREQERHVEEFYGTPVVRGASEFALGITGLSITNVKAVGHQFRKIVGDPAAKKLDKDRGEDTGTQTIPERVVGAANFLPTCFLDLGRVRARCVCKIEISGVDFQGVQGTWFGTGFLVAPDVLLTNHHVVNSIEVARTAWCIFNFEVGEDNRPLEAVAVRLEPERLFLTSPLEGGLDYTFVAIDRKAGERFGFIPLIRSAFTIHPGDRANIIQHPEGGHKKVTLQQNEILQDTGIVLHYASDTLGGSSGAPVFNNCWELIALHHASKKADGLALPAGQPPPDYLNEGIKISAIAADIEARIEASGGVTASRVVLKEFGGVDTLLGFFGALGRHCYPAEKGVERVVDTYSREGQDVDVAFWNVEWYTPCYKEKVDALAEVIVDLNFDVWALGETTVDAVRLLVERLHRDYDLDFGCGFAEPDAPAGTLQIGVLWNLTSAVCETVAWPAELDEWFRVDTQQFDGLRDEAVHGRIFERYPGLFRCRSTNRQPDADSFAFLLVPLQLPPARERSARTRMAAKILAAAVQRMQTAGESDWIVGGDYAAEQATQEFRGILRSSLVTLSAGEEGDSSIGAISYLKSPNSLIDNIFLSRNLGRTFGADDFFIVAADRAIPDYIRRLSQRSPLMVRISLADRLPKAADLPPSLATALGLT